MARCLWGCESNLLFIKNLEFLNFIKSDTGEIKIEATEVCGRWREYFEVLLNGENESEFDVVEAVEGPLYEITDRRWTAAGEISREEAEVVPHICGSGKGFR